MGLRTKNLNSIKMSRGGSLVATDYDRRRAALSGKSTCFMIGTAISTLDPIEGDPDDMSWGIMESAPGEFSIRAFKSSILDERGKIVPEPEDVENRNNEIIGAAIASVQAKNVKTAIGLLVAQLPADAGQRISAWRQSLNTGAHDPTPDSEEAYLPWTPIPEKINQKILQNWLAGQPGMENTKLFFPRINHFNRDECQEIANALFDFNDNFPGIVAGLGTLDLAGHQKTGLVGSKATGYYVSPVGKLAISGDHIHRYMSNPDFYSLKNFATGVKGMPQLLNPSPRGVIIHELAHVLAHTIDTDIQLEAVRKSELDMKLTDGTKKKTMLFGKNGFFSHASDVQGWAAAGISVYANANGSELFAETLTAIYAPNELFPPDPSNLSLKTLEHILPAVSTLLKSRNPLTRKTVPKPNIELGRKIQS